MPMPHKTRPLWLPELWAALLVLLLIWAIPVAQAATLPPPPLDRAMQAVFTVRSADTGARLLGSAFLWGDAGAVVTAAHVLGDARDVRLTGADGRMETAAVIAVDVVRDVAVLAVAPGRQGLRAGDVPGLGAAVYALGRALGGGVFADVWGDLGPRAAGRTCGAAAPDAA